MFGIGPKSARGGFNRRLQAHYGDESLSVTSPGLTGVGDSSYFFGSGAGLESRSLLLSFLQSE